MIAIIPARGGSKGIPGKNVVPLCGKPLMAWTIEQAKAALVDRVIVATDCELIADVALHYGAEAMPRSAESATDEAPTELVLHEVLRRVKGDQQDPWWEPVVLLQATSPIRQPNDITHVLSLLRDHDSVFSARRIEGYTWHQMSSGVSPNYSHRQPRQQRVHETLEENGSIYAFRAGRFLESGNRLHGKIGVHVMDPLDSFQVDEPRDLKLMEQLIPLRIPHQCR